MTYDYFVQMIVESYNDSYVDGLRVGDIITIEDGDLVDYDDDGMAEYELAQDRILAQQELEDFANDNMDDRGLDEE
jgi:hypothetical protein